MLTSLPRSPLAWMSRARRASRTLHERSRTGLACLVMVSPGSGCRHHPGRNHPRGHAVPGPGPTGQPCGSTRVSAGHPVPWNHAARRRGVHAACLPIRAIVPPLRVRDDSGRERCPCPDLNGLPTHSEDWLRRTCLSAGDQGLSRLSLRPAIAASLPPRPAILCHGGGHHGSARAKAGFGPAEGRLPACRDDPVGRGRIRGRTETVVHRPVRRLARDWRMPAGSLRPHG